MIQTVISILRIGPLFKAVASGALKLKRLTIIFAGNGRGKTTLASIFHSLKTGNPITVQERQTLGIEALPEVEFRLIDCNAKFVDGKWNKTLPDLEVFDTTFIVDNVHLGNHVDQASKRNLHRLIVGEKGVALAKDVDAFGDAIKEVNRKATAKALEVQKHAEGGVIAAEFVNLAVQSQVDEAIKQKEAEIGSLKKAAEIASKASLSKVVVPAIAGHAILAKSAVEALLSLQIGDMSKEAERLTQAHIASRLDQRGEQWLESGVKYHKDEACPFCAASTAGNQLVEALSSYFSDSYKSLKDGIRSCRTSAEQTLSDRALLGVQTVVSLNSQLIEFWGDHVTAVAPALLFDEIQRAATLLRSEILAAAEAKSAAPLEKLEVTPELLAAYLEFEALVARVAEYNASVDAFNAAISKTKEAAKAGSMVTAQIELTTLKNRKRRHEPAVAAVCKEYSDLLAEKKDLEGKKEQAKVALEKYAVTIFETYEGAINDYLEMFGASFKITDAKTVYPAGVTSAHYKLLLNNVEVELGDERTVGKPSFKTVLSESDKRTLAFAFFLAQLRHNSEAALANKIVVLDDPMASFDGHRKTMTLAEIKSLTESCKQVILMTHEPTFAWSAWDAERKHEKAAFQLRRSGETYSCIEEWDIEAEAERDYFRDHAASIEYLKNGPRDDKHMRDIAASLRGLLENALRVRFPDEFHGSERLGNMLARIRASGAGTALDAVAHAYDDLDRINDYSKKFHHGENPRFDSEKIDDSELKVFTKLTHRIIRGGDNKQSAPALGMPFAIGGPGVGVAAPVAQA